MQINTVGDWKLKRKLFTFSFSSNRLTPVGCGLRLRRSGSGALPTAAPVASAAVFAGRLRRALVLRIADLSSPSAWPESRSASPSHLSSETEDESAESPKSEPRRALNRRPPAGRTFFLFWAARRLCLGWPDLSFLLGYASFAFGLRRQDQSRSEALNKLPQSITS